MSYHTRRESVMKMAGTDAVQKFNHNHGADGKFTSAGLKTAATEKSGSKTIAQNYKDDKNKLVGKVEHLESWTGQKLYQAKHHDTEQVGPRRTSEDDAKDDLAAMHQDHLKKQSGK